MKARELSPLDPVAPPNGNSQTPPPIPDHELLRRIGGGAYGEVWLARSALGAYRAVKVIYRKSFEDSRPFDREFNGIRKFEPVSRLHEGVVDILQAGRQEDYFYYVMELADDAGLEVGSSMLETGCRMQDAGPASTANAQRKSSPPGVPDPEAYESRTLRWDLKRRGRLPSEECVRIGLVLTSALAHLHKHGLVHRDVKPSNIIFVQGVPKLADIGLVTDADTTLSYVGTEGYIPPEGPGAVQADIYSLGKVLYEISTGQDRRDFPDLPPDLKNWPDQAAVLELNEVLVKACARDVRSRYQSCQEMHDDLALLERGRSIKRQRVWQRRRSLAKILSLVATLTAVLALAVLWVENARRGHVPDPEAVRLYERARWLHSFLTSAEEKKAVESLNKALEIDPRFVPAYVTLFEIYLWTTRGVVETRDEHLNKMREIADRLLAINPKQAEGHAALSYRKFLERDWRGAEAEIRRAIQLNPDYPMAHSVYGYYLSLLGRTDEALPEAVSGEKLERDWAASRIAVLAGWYPFMASRQFDRAIAQLQRVVDRDQKFEMAHFFLGRCYEARSNYVEATQAFKMADLLSGEDAAETAKSYAALLQAYETGGERGYWEKKLEQFLHRANEPGGDRDSQVIAGCYARLGESEKALTVLEENFDEMAVWNSLRFEPMFDSLHDEPRFKALLKRAGLD